MRRKYTVRWKAYINAESPTEAAEEAKRRLESRSATFTVRPLSDGSVPDETITIENLE